LTSAARIRKDRAAPVQKKSIRFPARSFLAFALAPEAPLEEWLQALDGWTENSPGFFAGRPVVLDLATLKPEAEAIKTLVEELGKRGIRVYAIEGVAAEALTPDMPPLLTGAKPGAIEATQDEPAAAEPQHAEEEPRRADNDVAPPLVLPQLASTTLIINRPIRSGQSICHLAGDVIVLGSVGSGSEIMAGGSVHIYGTLRGRVFAGATGDGSARIFSLKNEAELLAIDGWYRTAEEMDQSARGKSVQVFLESGTIWVTPLG
jgi:septum site-determining protein MinC